MRISKDWLLLVESEMKLFDATVGTVQGPSRRKFVLTVMEPGEMITMMAANERENKLKEAAIACNSEG